MSAAPSTAPPPPRGDSHARMRAVAAPTAASRVVDLLVSRGLDTFFGVPGGPIIPVFDALLTHPEARLVHSRHESGACFAAMGYHRATGRVPVVVTTAGPGATNVVTGVVAASLERVPMLLICGDVPWASTGGRLLQDTGPRSIGIDRMLAPMLRADVRVARAPSAAAQVLAAVEAATDPRRPGPALAVLPLDHAGHRAPAAELSTSPRPAAPPAPATRALRLVEARLRAAERPLLVVGAGCRPVADAVRGLVEALQVPFLTTPRAKGLIGERHPLSLRNGGMSASEWARGYTRAEPDAALALGTDLDDVSTAGTPPIGPGGWLAHVDLDPEVFGRNFPTALGVVADAGAFAGRLAERAASRGPHPHGAALAARARASAAFDTPGFADDPRAPIAPHRVIADLEAAAGPDAVFVTDIGEHMLFALHYLTADGPERFVIHLGLGSMGSGIGSAIGLALGDRSRPVVCICGDGGMQMNGAELLVAIEHRLPIVYAVFNDARYNMVHHGYRLTFEREADWSTPPVDFVAWARAMGAGAARVDAPGQIDAALLSGARTDGPLVLDIRQDASVRIEGDGRVEAIRQMSMLHAAAGEGGE